MCSASNFKGGLSGPVTTVRRAGGMPLVYVIAWLAFQLVSLLPCTWLLIERFAANSRRSAGWGLLMRRRLGNRKVGVRGV